MSKLCVVPDEAKHFPDRASAEYSGSTIQNEVNSAILKFKTIGKKLFAVVVILFLLRIGSEGAQQNPDVLFFSQLVQLDLYLALCGNDVSSMTGHPFVTGDYPYEVLAGPSPAQSWNVKSGTSEPSLSGSFLSISGVADSGQFELKQESLLDWHEQPCGDSSEHASDESIVEISVYVRGPANTPFSITYSLFGSVLPPSSADRNQYYLGEWMVQHSWPISCCGWSDAQVWATQLGANNIFGPSGIPQFNTVSNFTVTNRTVNFVLSHPGSLPAQISYNGETYSLAEKMRAALQFWEDDWNVRSGRAMRGSGSVGLKMNVVRNPAPEPPCVDPVEIAAIPAPVPALVEFANGWRMNVQVSENDGLVLSDLALGDRYMARKITLPYYKLTTSAFSGRAELKPNSDDASARSRLVEFAIEAPATANASGSIRAKYHIDRIGKSTLDLVQEYIFSPENPADPTGPDHDFITSRFRPVVRYTFNSRCKETFSEINTVQRLHLQADGVTENVNETGRESLISSLLALDAGISVQNNQLFLGVSPLTGTIPLFREASDFAIKYGEHGSIDNYHQSFQSSIEKPFDISHQSANLFGCPECVHVHFGWLQGLPEMDLPVLDFFHVGAFNHIGLENPDSKQKVRVYVVQAHDGEESSEPETLCNNEILTNPVFYYSAFGSDMSDTFFNHGGFFKGKLKPTSSASLFTRHNYLDVSPLFAIEITSLDYDTAGLPLGWRTKSDFKTIVRITNVSKSSVDGPIHLLLNGFKQYIKNASGYFYDLGQNIDGNYLSSSAGSFAPGQQLEFPIRWYVIPGSSYPKTFDKVKILIGSLQQDAPLAQRVGQAKAKEPFCAPAKGLQ